MTQARKKRVVRFEVEIVAFTDFMEDLVTNFFTLSIKAQQQYLQIKEMTKTSINFKKIK